MKKNIYHYEDDDNKLGHGGKVFPDTMTTLFGALGYRVVSVEEVLEEKTKGENNASTD